MFGFVRLESVVVVSPFDLPIIPKCKGSVWVESVEGDRFNLKSSLHPYVVSVVSAVQHVFENAELVGKSEHFDKVNNVLLLLIITSISAA